VIYCVVGKVNAASATYAGATVMRGKLVMPLAVINYGTAGNQRQDCCVGGSRAIMSFAGATLCDFPSGVRAGRTPFSPAASTSSPRVRRCIFCGKQPATFCHPHRPNCWSK